MLVKLTRTTEKFDFQWTNGLFKGMGIYTVLDVFLELISHHIQVSNKTNLKIHVFWDETRPYVQQFEALYCLHLQSREFQPGDNSPNNIASHPRRLESLASLL
jgi:hypothetical protein